MSLPAYGTDAAGANAYASVVAARTGEEYYDYLIAWCTTKSAILSLDGGTTDHAVVLAGQAPMKVSFDQRQGAIQAKNLVTDNNYAALYVIIGRERRR